MDSNIYTDGTYLKNNPDWGMAEANWKAKIISELLNKNKIMPGNITEVGCGSGGILKSLSHYLKDTAKLTGYDISPQAIALANKFENEKLHFYNEDFLQKNIHSDLLLLIDVLEHVDDYYTFLDGMKSKSKYFIFHIPLDLACRTILKPHILLQHRNTVGHIHYFTKEMVVWMLHDKGYKIIDWHYTKPTIDTNKPDNFKRLLKKMLRNFSFSINKDLSAKLWGGYSMLILAK